MEGLILFLVIAAAVTFIFLRLRKTVKEGCSCGGNCSECAYCDNKEEKLTTMGRV